MSKRTMNIRYDQRQVNSTWSNASITVVEFKEAKPVKQVTIGIRNPSDLADFRSALDEIEASWRRQLGVQ